MMVMIVLIVLKNIRKFKINFKNKNVYPYAKEVILRAEHPVRHAQKPTVWSWNGPQHSTMEPHFKDEEGS